MTTGTKVLLAVFLCTASLILLRCVLRKGGGKAFFLSALQGMAAVFAVNVAGAVTGITVAVNGFSLLTSAALGLPGVAGLLFMNILLG